MSESERMDSGHHGWRWPAFHAALAIGCLLAVYGIATPETINPPPATTPDGAGVVVALDMPTSITKLYSDVRDWKDPSLRTWVDAKLAVDTGAQWPARLHARGHSSARFARKSFTVDLLSTRVVMPSFVARKLFLLNLAFDQHGFEMRFSYRILADLGVFAAFNQLVRVAINGEDQGLYLLVERPRDAIRREHPNAVSVLRTWAHGIETIWTADDVDAGDVLSRLSQAQGIADPTERARRVSELLDVDALAKWMAFNSLVRNADTVDELFLFEVCSSGEPHGKLGVMAWDYDDLMSPPAHPENVHQDPLTWACETSVEKTILTTPLLRQRYQAALHELLTTTLTDRAIHDHLAGLQQTLNVIAPVGRLDRHSAMRAFEAQLLARRRHLLKKLGAG